MPQFDYGYVRLSAAIFCPSDDRALQLRALAEASGCSLRDSGQPADFLLTDLCSIPNETGADWAEIARYLAGNDCQALVWLRLEGVDAAYAALPVEQCHFLVDAFDWQAVPILSGAFKHVKLDQLHDLARDGELDALHRISNELADFARTLARIAEQDENPTNAVRDKPIGFRAASPDMFKPFAAEPETPRPPEIDSKHIREIIKLRRMRDSYFQSELFADPAWDIMLDLLAAHAEGKQVSVSSLCIAASVPPTTALRWITNMTDSGLLVRKQDPYDARRVFIELSDDMTEKLTAYFAATMERAPVPI